MEPSLENMFDKKRIPGYFHAFPLFFYFPFGIVLVMLRFFIGIHAFLTNILLSHFPTLRNYILRIMCLVLGFVVIPYHSDRSNDNIKIMVANHITNYDHLPIRLAKPCVVPSVWDLPKLLNWILGYTDFGITQGRPIFIENVKNFMKDSSLPVLVFPEGATSNGKVGLLKFSPWASLLGYPIQPVALQVLHPPFIYISHSVLGSRWWTDIFWLLFVPYTVFVVRFLPVMSKNENETFEEFCYRIQDRISKELNVKPTNITAIQKVKYAQGLFGCSDNLVKKSL